MLARLSYALFLATPGLATVWVWLGDWRWLVTALIALVTGFIIFAIVSYNEAQSPSKEESAKWN